MKITELFRTDELSRDDVLKRIKNAKSQAEKEKWAVYLVKHRHGYIFEEKLSDYLRRLVDALNIKKLGSGAYSNVFQHPHYSNVVVKVYTARDKKYARYVKWCLAHQSNPYVPQIIGQTEYVSPISRGKESKYNILFMQKMEPVSEAAFARLLSKSFTKLTSEDRELLKDVIDSYDMEELFDRLNSFVKRGVADSSFVEIWNHVKTYGRQNFDLHHGNVMKRGTQLVVTDPVASEPTSRVDQY